MAFRIAGLKLGKGIEQRELSGKAITVVEEKPSTKPHIRLDGNLVIIYGSVFDMTGDLVL